MPFYAKAIQMTGKLTRARIKCETVKRSDIKPANINKIVSANNSKMNVKNVGKTILRLNENEIEVGDVLHVPDLVANLLSVNKIVEKGNSVMFNEIGCTIKNKNDDIVAHCSAKNCVYKFSVDNGVCMLGQQSENAMLWHK